MATYRSVSLSEYDADSPVTTQLMAATVENAIAITEGASGAPRIVTAALAAPTVDTGSGYQVFALQGSSVSESGTGTINADPTVDLQPGQIIVAGDITVRLQHRMLAATGTSQAVVYRNGSSVASWTTTSTSYQTRTVDITVAVGDIIQVRHVVSAGTGTCQLQNAAIRCGEPNVVAV